MPLVAAAAIVAAAPPTEPAPPSLEPGWHASWHSQSEYPRLEPGEVREFWIKFANVGTETWERGVPRRQVNLAINGDDRTPFRLGMAVDWLWEDRLATTTAPRVRPGEIGEFRFKIRAPAAAGTYRLNLRPVVDGTTWLEDEGVFWLILVDAGFAARWVGSTTQPSLRPGEEAELFLEFRNSGRQAWERGVASRQVWLAVRSDDPSFARWGVGWISANRLASATQALVRPGDIGTFLFRIRVPPTLPSGTHRIPLGLVVDGVTWLDVGAEASVFVVGGSAASRLVFRTLAAGESEGEPLDPGDSFELGTQNVFAFFDFDGLSAEDRLTLACYRGSEQVWFESWTLAQIYVGARVPARGGLILWCEFGAQGAPAGAYVLEVRLNGVAAHRAPFTVGGATPVSVEQPAAPAVPPPGGGGATRVSAISWSGTLPSPPPTGPPGEAPPLCAPRAPGGVPPDTTSGCGGPSAPFSSIGTGREPFFPPRPPLAATNYRVQGVVRDADSGTPLAGICLLVGYTCLYRTGADGSYWYDFPRWQMSGPRWFHPTLRLDHCGDIYRDCDYYEVASATIDAAWSSTAVRPANPIAVVDVWLKRQLRGAVPKPTPRPRQPSTPCTRTVGDISWTVSAADYVLINGVAYPRSGQVSLPPGNYVVVAVNAGGSWVVARGYLTACGIWRIST